MKFCCDKMNYFIFNNKEKGGNDADDIIRYVSCFDEYGIVIHDGGQSCVGINYCPWCGMRLPDSKRDLWFETLEKLGFENPLEEDIPKKFQSNDWWEKNLKL